jgi:hypothetical protein
MTQLELQIPTAPAVPEWLNAGPGSKVAQVYLLLKAAGDEGLTNVQLRDWGVEHYCTSVLERARDIRKAKHDSLVVTPGKTRGTWLYRLA